MSHTAALGDMFFHYYEHGQCETILALLQDSDRVSKWNINFLDLFRSIKKLIEKHIGIFNKADY